MISVDVVLVNLEEGTAYCSDGVTRSFLLYDAQANQTDDPDEAIAAVVKVADGKFVLVGLTADAEVPVN